MCVGSNPTPDIILSNIKLVTSKVYAKYTTPAGIRTPDLWIRNPMRYPLRYKGCVSLLGHQDTNYAKWFHPLSTAENISLVCMFQWRNRLARGTYTVVHVRNAEVVSSSLTWNSGFWSKQFYFINRCYPSPTNYCAIDPAPLTPIRFK